MPRTPARQEHPTRTTATRPAPARSSAQPGTESPRLLPDRYLTPEDLTAMFCLPSVETVYAWRRKRIGPPAIRIGKYLRYDPAAVREWVTQQSDPDQAA